MRSLVHTAMIACAALSVQTGVAHAGFFDMFFGGQAQAPSYAPPPLDGTYLENRPFEKMRRRASRAEAGSKEDHAAIKEAARTTDIMHDRTLRSGDAVMTASGVRVFDGEKSNRHDADDFAKLTDTQGISRELRTTLDAINAHRSQPSWQTGEAELPLQTGRSSVSPVQPARTAVDQSGHTIRVVGP